MHFGLRKERLLPLPELSRKIEGPVREGYSSRERTVEAKLYPFQPPASSYHTLYDFESLWIRVTDNL